MKLLLSSAGWEYNLKIGKEFLDLTDKEPSEIKVFLVTTATKKDREWGYVEFTIKELERIGINKNNVSIFSLNRKVKDADFKGIDAIYVCGGNTFHYLNGIRKTGLDEKIIKTVKEGAVYFGVSAGSIIAGPDISIAGVGAEDPDENDIKLKNLKGLGLTNLVICSHFNTKEKKIVKEFEKNSNQKIIRLTDKQAFLIKNGKNRLIE